jgi:hypothetical protein
MKERTEKGKKEKRERVGDGERNRAKENNEERGGKEGKKEVVK